MIWFKFHCKYVWKDNIELRYIKWLILLICWSYSLNYFIKSLYLYYQIVEQFIFFSKFIAYLNKVFLKLVIFYSSVKYLAHRAKQVSLKTPIYTSRFESTKKNLYAYSSPFSDFNHISASHSIYWRNYHFVKEQKYIYWWQ